MGKRGEEYRCSECGQVYLRGRDDEPALEEAAARGMDEDLEIICDDCFKAIMRQN